MIESEAKEKRCPFGAGFYPPVNNCIGKSCMAWRIGRETDDLPVGIDPPLGSGWTKYGPPTGAGGAITLRQRWERVTGWCGHVFNDR